MSVQSLFYLFGTIYMVLGILLMLMVMIVLFYAVHVISQMKQNVDEKIETIKSVTSHPNRIAQGMGAIIADAISFGIGSLFRRI